MAERYLADSESIGKTWKWQRCAKILKSLADGYFSEAKHTDDDVELCG